ncbi:MULTISPECIES: hypothetical protein [Acinetobacter]|uniref:Lipoprotein n=1 Tax=Acinetobacter parvus DSM 16617 = CIP 108168 TaxID=981333 RepID=N8RVR5_9GAMM|nr:MULTISPECIES: hypothetical protein [Acinetobacter]ENU37619.1 hypothetical protein F988_00197 [Acinetobacter parvus DSM 16617 = CIP 108168]MCU4394972.1 hypothetical protein [Acinetobacter parvus]
MKRRLAYSILLCLGAATTLTACQNAPNVVDQVRIVQNTLESKADNTTLYCSGVENCEFERIGDIAVIDAKSHRISQQAMERGIVRLHGSVFSRKQQVYLSIPAKQYEVVIRFYPISLDRAEMFHVIHEFKPNQSYTFKMYRDRAYRSGSLLNVSAPEPLCVDLQQEQHTIRRFCRPYDVSTGLGEFVEKKI